MEEMYKIPPIYVIIKPMIVLFMSYDYDIAWNDEFVCDSVWSRDCHDDTGSRVRLMGTQFVSVVHRGGLQTGRATKMRRRAVEALGFVP